MFGGFDKYHNEFETLLERLEQAGQMMSDDQKRTFFLNGIIDKEYGSMKNNCIQDTYDATVLKLRYRAIEMGKQSGLSRRSHNKVTKKIGKSAPPKTRGPPRKGENNRNLTGERIPDKIWNAMTPQQRRVQIESRKKTTSEDKPAPKQYSGARNANAATTSATREDEDDEKSSRETTPNIFKAVRRVAMVKTAKGKGKVQAIARKEDDRPARAGPKSTGMTESEIEIPRVSARVLTTGAKIDLDKSRPVHLDRNGLRYTIVTHRKVAWGSPGFDIMRSDGYYCTWPARKVIDKGLHGILRTYLRINDLRYDPVFEDTWEEVDLY
jgi:hypothetical protein